MIAEAADSQRSREIVLDKRTQLEVSGKHESQDAKVREEQAHFEDHTAHLQKDLCGQQAPNARSHLQSQMKLNQPQRFP
jgi:hypothetical protein